MKKKKCQYLSRLQIWSWAQVWHIMFASFEILSMLKEALMAKTKTKKLGPSSQFKGAPRLNIFLPHLSLSWHQEKYKDGAKKC